ncbi:MAG: YeeE/YedE family protein [Bacteroidetes bacterium MedPE-SWsnd-G1]|nr:MAG: YeeE/YedE family protein [Bacteroidetes bacterium MedPE-SWsnd-G1]
MEFLFNPWPWFVSGPLIAFTLFLLLMIGKRFGMSSNLRTICAIGGAGKKVIFFNFDWKAQRWNLIVAVGVLIGGYIAANYLTVSDAVILNPETVNDLHEMGFKSAGTAYMPTELFDMSVFGNVKNIIVLIVGGLLVGFGARYAGGCTSGHAISGLSNLQLPSLIAVIGFFIGGLLMVHVLFPLIF